MKDNNEKYEIIETLATGGMAVLYKAIQVSLNRTVVIKKLHPHLAADKKFVERFEREAAILGQMSHPNIVNIIDYFIKDNDYYIVLEYIDGFSLSKLISKQGALPLSVAVYIIQEVLRGLSYAHNNKILHRDIKPDNIMIEKKTATVKITDFGLATGESFKNLTRPGGYIGTVAYLAPEIVKGEKPTVQSDIYSVGLTFCEMLTGVNPMSGDSEYDVINKILYHKKIDLQLPATMPIEVKDIFNKMVAFDKDKRYKNCEEILDDLEDLPYAAKDQFKAYIESPVIKSGSLPIAKVSIEERKVWEKKWFIMTLIFISVFIGGISGWIWNEWINKERSLTFSSGMKNSQKMVAIDTLKEKNNKTISDSLLSEFSDTQSVKKEVINKNDIKNIKKTKKVSGFGYLSVIVKPWADIYVDGKYFDKTPLKDPIKLKAGKHTIKFVHPHRKVVIDTVNIGVRDTLLITKELQVSYGYAKIIVKPWAEVYIDGKSIGTTPIGGAIKLLIGKHELVLKNPRYGLWKDTIDVKENDTLELSISLLP